MDKYFGVYKGTGSHPWFGGEVYRSGEPASDGPGCWAGDWFRTKKAAMAEAHARKAADSQFKASFKNLV
ncbi:MAG: hypothetical protein ABSG90_11440 [Dehalococcoidia bacterium]|jgi:hypothetical protein